MGSCSSPTKLRACLPGPGSMTMVGPASSAPSDAGSLREGLAPRSQKRVPVVRNLAASLSIDAFTMTPVPAASSATSVTWPTCAPRITTSALSCFIPWASLKRMVMSVPLTSSARPPSQMTTISAAIGIDQNQPGHQPWRTPA